MDENYFEELLKKKLSEHEEIFSNYIKNNYIDSIAKISTFLDERKLKETLKDFSFDVQKLILEKRRSFNEEEVFSEGLHILNLYDNSPIDDYYELSNAYNYSTSINNFGDLIKACGSNCILPHKIQELSFCFEDLKFFDDRAIQKILREVDMCTLARALKIASSEIHEKIFMNMSKRAANMLAEDIEFMGPVAKSAVLDSQNEISNIASRLIKCGEILFNKSDSDVLVDCEISPELKKKIDAISED